MKKLLLLVAASLLLLALPLSGCTDSAGTETPAPTQAVTQSATGAPTAAPTDDGLGLSGVNEFPIVSETVELDFFASGNNMVEDMNTNWTTEWYEEMTNVHINWEVVTSDFAQKLNLSLSSGEYPDVYWNASLNTTQLLFYGSQGVFLPLNDLIDEYTFYIPTILEQRSDIKQAITAPNGNIYTLFRTSGVSHSDTQQKMWVYKPWLDQLDLEMPTTTQEYHELLKAFSENDMNGNGDPSDEFPLIGSTNGWMTDVTGFLMNPFILNDGGKRLNLVDGQVVPAFTQPEWKEGLHYLNTLYNEGLLAKESFVQDNSQLLSLTTSPDNIVIGTIPAAYPGVFVNIQVVPDGYVDYVVIPPLKGDSRESITPYFPSDVSIGCYTITSACEYPEVAIKWADYWCSEEGTMLSTYGREGIEYEFVNIKSIDGRDQSLKPIIVYTEPQNFMWKGMGPRYFTTAMRNGEYYDERGLATILYVNSQPYVECLSEENIPKFLWMDEAQVNALSSIETIIKDYVNESMTKFIVGERDIDQEWDAYLAELDSMGLNDYVSIYQQAIE